MFPKAMSPKELVEYCINYPDDMPLSTIVKKCDEAGYVIPPEKFAKLEALDALRTAKKHGKRMALVEPNIPAGYRKGASAEDPIVTEQGHDGGVLADDGASGVLIEGGNDMDRGVAAASFLLAVQRRCHTNDAKFVDWANMVDSRRAAPLYGPDSVDAALDPLKSVSILVLHGVDYCAGSRDGAENLGKVLRSRAANGGKTIMTSSVTWPALERAVGKDSDLHRYLATCIAGSNDKVNVTRLADE